MGKSFEELLDASHLKGVISQVNVLETCVLGNSPADLSKGIVTEAHLEQNELFDN
jgi:hypothetical protein